jgi:hypothetical protein
VNTDYEAVALELYRTINGEREASKALLHHALEAVGELKRFREREKKVLWLLREAEFAEQRAIGITPLTSAIAAVRDFKVDP